MTSRLTIRRPGRAATVVGAVIAVGATTALAVLAGPASADEPGRCVENVNVRAEPNSTSRIVALCEAGTRVQVGETSGGFVRVTDLGGWAATEFVAVDGAGPTPPALGTPATPTGAARPTSVPAPDRSGSAPGHTGTTDPTEITASRPRPVGGDPDSADRQPAPGTARDTGGVTAPTSAPTAPQATPAPAPLGGLLGG